MSGRRGVLLLAVVGVLFVAGWPAANVGAAPPPPTLAILSPADHAVIGDGSPLVIVFAVQNFNLTEPGTVGPGPATNEGHVNVSVDGNLAAVVSQPTVVLALDSGTYQVRLRLVSDNGTPLTPDVSASITVTLTRGPAGGTPRIAITYVEILYPIPGDVSPLRGIAIVGESGTGRLCAVTEREALGGYHCRRCDGRRPRA